MLVQIVVDVIPMLKVTGSMKGRATLLNETRVVHLFIDVAHVVVTQKAGSHLHWRATKEGRHMRSAAFGFHFVDEGKGVFIFVFKRVKGRVVGYGCQLDEVRRAVVLLHSTPRPLHLVHLLLHDLPNHVPNVHGAIALNLDLLPPIAALHFFGDLVALGIGSLFCVAFPFFMVWVIPKHAPKRPSWSSHFSALLLHFTVF